jgi:hypothetical protein
MKRKKRGSSSSHVSKSPIERNNYTRAVRNTGVNPTIISGSSTVSTLSDVKELNEDIGVESYSPTRENRKNRFILYIKENWPNYIVSIIGIIVFFFFVTANIKLAEINKDISYQSKLLDTNAAKIEDVSGKVASLYGEVKSLNDRFMLITDLFGQNRDTKIP